jgi:hypothetical protein
VNGGCVVCLLACLFVLVNNHALPGQWDGRQKEAVNVRIGEGEERSARTIGRKEKRGGALVLCVSAIL